MINAVVTGPTGSLDPSLRRLAPGQAGGRVGDMRPVAGLAFGRGRAVGLALCAPQPMPERGRPAGAIRPCPYRRLRGVLEKTQEVS